ncbi:unnamed protein product [Ostreobium quekettii]|uniref:RRM domain-containing protein n=1 Tax=Ostreobium quekettii TaxID=121088 RepID=A0A8S1J8D4_9CHLO|nr:unnamed protein product [Ostreobium quekettii]|eukprot:evm.model.scf_44.4 EVM.evm.TU.scf_44.4   scf_44:82527-85376(-)
MKYVPKVKDEVEIIMDESGFKDSFFAATVLSLEGNKAIVEYFELLEGDDEGDASEKLRDDVPFTKVRPVADDDSMTKRATDRHLGDAVDCWYNGGWWKGYVHKIFEDSVEVFFPSSPNEELKVFNQVKDDQTVRVRSAFDWLPESSEWRARERVVYHGARDHRYDTMKLVGTPKKRPRTASRREATQDQARGLDKRSAQSRAIENWSDDEDEEPARPVKVKSKSIEDGKKQMKPPVQTPQQPDAKQKEQPQSNGAGTGAKLTSKPAAEAKHKKERPLGSLTAGRPAARKENGAGSLKGDKQAAKKEKAMSSPADGEPMEKKEKAKKGGIRQAENVTSKKSALGIGALQGMHKVEGVQDRKVVVRGEKIDMLNRAKASSARGNGADLDWPRPQVEKKDAGGGGKKLAAVGKKHMPGTRLTCSTPRNHEEGKRLKVVSNSQRARDMQDFFLSPSPKRSEAKDIVDFFASPKKDDGNTVDPKTEETGDGHPKATSVDHFFEPPVMQQAKMATAMAEDTHNDPKMKPGAAPPSKPFTIPKLSDDPTFLSNVDMRGWRERLQDRKTKDRRYNGEALESKVCIDNLGFAFDEECLRDELKSRFGSIVEVEFATGSLNGMRYSAGWCCVTFPSNTAAALALEKLDKMYLKVGACPIPRPLIAHFPMWMGYPWGKQEAMPGFLKVDSVVPPHFSQRNTIEFHSAIQWRRHVGTARMTKDVMCEENVNQLCDVIRKYSAELEQPDNGAFSQGPPPGVPNPCLWLKGVPLDIDNSALRTAYEQFDDKGRCKVSRPNNPASGSSYGHAVVEFGEEGKAVHVLEDMRRHIFHCGGTPRPVEADLFQPGRPHGFQDVFDRALARVLGIDMSRVKPELLRDMRVVTISEAATPVERCAKELRARLDFQMQGIAEYYREMRAVAWELHYEQQKMFDMQRTKYELLTQATEYQVIKSIVGDGPAV